ncbi:MAG: hypothetical protein L6R48_11635 [Planctomycetes bacterium]|nr:hypothetical protein [Planctomycetota bacterium]
MSSPTPPGSGGPSGPCDAAPPGLLQAFRTAAGELGHAGAAEIFVREIAEERGDAGVTAFRDVLGRDFPVADALAGRWLAGWRPGPPALAPLLRHLQGIHRLAVVGLEARHLDALVDARPDLEVALLAWNALPADWERIIANCGGRVQAVDLDGIFGWAGPHSAVLCLVYGDPAAGTVYAPPAWLRLNGPDMRPQFRSLIAWNILPVAFTVYPRWFHEVQVDDFTALEDA